MLLVPCVADHTQAVILMYYRLCNFVVPAQAVIFTLKCTGSFRYINSFGSGLEN